jgi:hypothetical protein
VKTGFDQGLIGGRVELRNLKGSNDGFENCMDKSKTNKKIE